MYGRAVLAVAALALAAPGLAAGLGKPVVIESRPGSGGVIGDGGAWMAKGAGQRDSWTARAAPYAQGNHGEAAASPDQGPQHQIQLNPLMRYVTDAMTRMVGTWGRTVASPDPVERGAVRRYAQAIMDADPAYMEPDDRFGVPVAPPLYPMNMFRAPFGASDVLTKRASDADFDGLTADIALGLDPLPLPLMVLLNGGTRVALHRYARHGETVRARSRYLEITEKASKTGPLVVVVVETEYSGAHGEVLLVVEKTLLRRTA